MRDAAREVSIGWPFHRECLRSLLSHAVSHDAANRNEKAHGTLRVNGMVVTNQ
jgi:hypothetical protein